MNSRTRSSAVAALAAATSLVMAPVAGATQSGTGAGTADAVGFTAEEPGAAANVSWRPGESPDVMSRGDRRGQGREGDQTEEPAEPEDECPTELWTIPIEIKGLACILLLGKPADEGVE